MVKNVFFRYLCFMFTTIFVMGLLFIEVAQSDCRLSDGNSMFATDPYVVLYEDANFRGRSLACGTGEVATIKKIKISSIKVVDNWYQLIVYDEENFKGNRKIVEYGQYEDLGDWNDRIRSLVIEGN